MTLPRAANNYNLSFLNNHSCYILLPAVIIKNYDTPQVVLRIDENKSKSLY